MTYRVDNGIWGSVFAVPTEIVDKHIKMCGPVALKVLLLLLRHGGRMEAEEMASLLNQAASDVRDAMNTWIDLGIIIQAEEEGEQAPLVAYREERAAPVPAEKPGAEQPRKPVPPAPPAPAREERQVATITRSRQRLSTQEINEMAEKDENIAYLLQETQACLGKTLTPVATDVVVALYSYYGMQPDLVMMLLHYCVSIGKGNMRYVEKVAASWLEGGIDTHEKAEQEILRCTRKRESEGRIKTAFGIYDRSLVPSEKKYIKTWLEEYHMDIALIQLAYERTVELKGKLSFAYINGILTNWHAKGIATPAQAVQEIKQGRPDGAGTKKEDAQSGSSYDMAELEQMISRGGML